MQPFLCPHCSGIFQITPNLAGQAVACPHCNGGVLIPETATPSEPSQPPVLEPPPQIGSAAQATTIPTETSAPPLVTPALVTPPSIPAINTPATQEPDLFAAQLVNEAKTEKTFVIPTLDGGQAVIRETTRTAVSGTKRRELPDLTSEQKATRRFTKNLIVIGLCAVLLVFVLWWLLANGPL